MPPADPAQGAGRNQGAQDGEERHQDDSQRPPQEAFREGEADRLQQRRNRAHPPPVEPARGRRRRPDRSSISADRPRDHGHEAGSRANAHRRAPCSSSRRRIPGPRDRPNRRRPRSSPSMGSGGCAGAAGRGEPGRRRRCGGRGRRGRSRSPATRKGAASRKRTRAAGKDRGRRPGRGRGSSRTAPGLRRARSRRRRGQGQFFHEHRKHGLREERGMDRPIGSDAFVELPSRRSRATSQARHPLGRGQAEGEPRRPRAPRSGVDWPRSRAFPSPGRGASTTAASRPVIAHMSAEPART